MRTYDRPAYTPAQLAEQWNYRSMRFQSKETRDAVAKLLTQQGVKVTKRSSRGDELHPEYVADYVGLIESGFGNTMYKTYFPHLYSIEGPL